MTNSSASGSVVSQSVQGNSASFNTFSDYDVEEHLTYDSTTYHGQWFSGDFNLQQPVVPYDDSTQRIWDYVIEENFSRHQPKKPITGVFVHDGSDADTDTESTGTHIFSLYIYITGILIANSGYIASKS